MTTRRVANPIAVRRYAVVGEPGREVVLTIGKPRPDATGDNWCCSVFIDGIPGGRHRVYGIDAVQALQMAMAYARYTFDRSGLTLTWLDGEPMEIGLPMPAPGCYGLEFQIEMERLMERKVRQMSEALMAIHRERNRRRAGKRSG